MKNREMLFKLSCVIGDTSMRKIAKKLNVTPMAISLTLHNKGTSQRISNEIEQVISTNIPKIKALITDKN